MMMLYNAFASLLSKSR